MESVAACLGGKVLGQVKEQEFWTALPRLRKACGDRAVLRAVHYFEENARALAQRNALVSGDFNAFLQLILEVDMPLLPCARTFTAPQTYGIRGSLWRLPSVRLAGGAGGSLADAGRRLCRDHSGVCTRCADGKYHNAMENVFGAGSCYLLRLREQGALQVI